jgi:ribose-phosphate pyrophosphokinase
MKVNKGIRIRTFSNNNLKFKPSFLNNNNNNNKNKSKAISEDNSSASSYSSSSADIFADLVDSSPVSNNNNSNNNNYYSFAANGSTGENILNQHNASISPTKNVLKVFSGSAHPELSTEIANYLGMDLGKLTIKKFADGEIYVQINESIRGSDVFLVQPTCPPTNDNIMELLVMIDACRRASCRSITAVIPYFGYARADRRTAGRESIAAKLVANLLTQAGATRAVLMDIHSLQTIGYYDIPVDHIYGETVILDYLTSKDFHPDEVVVVSPDVGGVPRARAFAKKLADAPLAIIDKRRTGHNKAQVMNLIGDVEGKVCVMLDDMIDTGGTLLAGAELCRTLGAREVYACATHAVFSPPAVERLGSGAFTEVIVTNSIPHTPERDFAQLTVLSVGNLLGETIWRVHNDTPVSFNKL